MVEGISVLERRGIRGYSDHRVLAQLGFGLARAWLALAWLGLAWLGCDNIIFRALKVNV